MLSAYSTYTGVFSMKIGDKVQLIMGGPEMTVVHKDGDLIHAWYFDANGCLQRLVLEPELLQPFKHSPWRSLDPFKDIPEKPF